LEDGDDVPAEQEGTNLMKEASDWDVLTQGDCYEHSVEICHQKLPIRANADRITEGVIEFKSDTSYVNLRWCFSLYETIPHSEVARLD
jgi:hypothetical protein